MKRIIILAATALIAAAAAQAKTDKDNLRVLYWNIQNGMWCGQPTDYKEFVDFVKEQNPDVCVWCEAATIYYDGTYTKKPKEECYLPGHWPELAKKYGHKYTYLGGHRDNYPQVITSKYPIEGMARITGEESDTIVSHGAGWARIEKNGHKINIVSLHTWPQRFSFDVRQQPDSVRKADGAAKGGDKYRRKEIEYVCNHTILSQPGAADEMWMMMGDFNSVSRMDNYIYKVSPDDSRYLVHNYILDNTPYIDVVAFKNPLGHTKTTGGGGARIDFIYLTRPLYDRVTHADAVWNDYTSPVQDKQFKHFWHPSDHLPILVDIDMKK